MHNNISNQEFTDLVFNWLNLFAKQMYWGDITNFSTEDDKPFTKDYLGNLFQSWDMTNIPEGADAAAHIYLEPDSNFIMVTDEETWEKESAEEEETWMTFKIELPDLYIYAHVN